MKTFKQFLSQINEYLTPEEHQSFAHIQMTPTARKHTDHFFGKDNNEVKEDVPGMDQDKSEVHKKIEHHLGTSIHPDHYRSGHFINEKGNKVRIGKVLKDPALLKSFNEDSTRRGGRSSGSYTSRIVRGTEVAGQTHPTHSWGQESCKNLHDGSNRQYLGDEIRHGTAVHYVHDKDGKEIYRATLQPHDGPSGRIYAVNSEYGLKHPAFQAHAHDIAKRLSTATDTNGLFAIHPSVYNDSHLENSLHPNLKASDLDALSNHADHNVRGAVVGHHAAEERHIDKALNDENTGVRGAAIRNTRLVNKTHLRKALKDPSLIVRTFAAKHPKMDHDLLTTALKDPSTLVKMQALEHPNLNDKHIELASTDANSTVRNHAKTLKSRLKGNS